MKYFILLSITLLSITSCNNDVAKRVTPREQHASAKHTTTQRSGKLPFIGKRSFETRPAASGTGTPHRYMEIRENGDVYFVFGQTNMSDGSEIKEKYYAGKFKPFLKCVFKKLDNETTWYEISKEKIYETDEDHKRLSNEDCCTNDDYISGKQCECGSEFDTIGTSF